MSNESSHGRQSIDFNLIPASITSPAGLGWELTWSITSSTCWPPCEHQRTVGQPTAPARVVIGEQRYTSKKKHENSIEIQDFDRSVLQTKCIWQPKKAVKHDDMMPIQDGLSFHLDCRAWFSWIVHTVTRCKNNKWLTISSGFNNWDFQLESRRLNNQSVQSFTWVPFGGLVGSLAWVPVLCHLGSTMSTAYVVRRVRDRRGRLDNYHDVTHDLLLFFIVISSCRLSLSSSSQTMQHLNTWHYEKHHIQVSRWQSSTDLGDEAFKVVTLPETNNPSGPKRKFHLSTIIYLQGRAVSPYDSVREGKTFQKWMSTNQLLYSCRWNAKTTSMIIPSVVIN